MISIQRRDDGAAVHIVGELSTVDGSVPDFGESLGDARQIDVYIDSFGGCSSVAFPLHDILRERDATAHILNRCWSAAAIVAAGCKHIRLARGGSIMIHEVRASCFGTREKMLDKAAWLSDANERQVRIFSNRFRCSHEAVRRWLSADSIFPADGAHRLGLVDGLFDLPANVSDFGGAVQVMATPAACDESRAELLRKCLEAIGPITTNNREALLRDVRAWALLNIQQFAAPCDPASFAEVACPSLAA